MKINTDEIDRLSDSEQLSIIFQDGLIYYIISIILLLIGVILSVNNYMLVSIILFILAILSMILGVKNIFLSKEQRINYLKSKLVSKTTNEAKKTGVTFTKEDIEKIEIDKEKYMKECPNCKTMIDESVKYCYNCGKKVDEVIRNDNNIEEKPIKTKKCKYCQSEINVKAIVCPQCHSKLKYFNIWKVLLVIIICICFFLFVSYYYYRYSIGYNEYGENNVDEYINDYRENEKEKNNVRFSLLEHGYSSDTNEYITYIEGKIKNNGTYDVDYITVTFTLYDANGNNIGTCSDINNGLKGRETWKFKAMCTAEINEIDHYELKEIYGY